MNEVQNMGPLQASLVLASTPAECADLASRAQAVLAYAKHINLSRTECNRIVRFRIDCMRKAGEMLRASGLGRGKKSVTVTDFGIDDNQSSLWQRIARIDEATIEHFANDRDAAGEELTIAGLLRWLKASAKAEKQAVVAEAAGETPALDESGVEVGVADGEPIAAAASRFACIYADPPWQYGNKGTRAAAADHYDTMTVDEICALPVREMAAENAHLHLWTTNAFLFEAKRVMEAWGFTYKSCFVWVKPQMGIGNYWRVSHEFMLFGIRGECPFLARDAMSWMSLPRGRHSAKPNEIRKLIERVSPGPRLEMFARERHEGWSAWGNQVPSTQEPTPGGV
jgi:N6-adenosine-specific RNA methylase IME4